VKNLSVQLDAVVANAMQALRRCWSPESSGRKCGRKEKPPDDHLDARFVHILFLYHL